MIRDGLDLRTRSRGMVNKPLGDLVRIRNGRDHKGLGEGTVPVYGSGGIMRHADSFVYDSPSVLIPRKGSLGNVFFVDTPFWTVDTIFYTEIDEDQIVPKYLYYYLTTVGLERMNQAGGVPSQTQAVLNRIKIPVPKLAIQRTIVAVLDKMEKLKSELESELDYRSAQFAYYRDSLLSFETDSAVESALMGDVGEFIRGRRFTKKDIVASGIPSIHYGEIYTHYGVSATTARSEVREDLANQLRYAHPNDVVFAAVGETVEDVAKAVAWIGDTPVAIHDDTFLYRSALNPKFVAYFAQTADFHAQKNRHVARAKVKRVSGDGLGKIRIPIPAPAEQERIVGILDAFDALVADLVSGLPAEIEARRKQYEYYRDNLLTFEEEAE